MKVLRPSSKISLHRETIRSLDLVKDSLRQANGAARTSLCTIGHPHCDTVPPCVHG